jgi:hypothetical protein
MIKKKYYYAVMTPGGHILCVTLKRKDAEKKATLYETFHGVPVIRLVTITWDNGKL